VRRNTNRNGESLQCQRWSVMLARGPRRGGMMPLARISRTTR
jgi:hypothetical protein